MIGVEVGTVESKQKEFDVDTHFIKGTKASNNEDNDVDTVN